MRVLLSLEAALRGRPGKGTFLRMSKHLFVFIPEQHSSGLFSDNQIAVSVGSWSLEREHYCSPMSPGLLFREEINDFGD